MAVKDAEEAAVGLPAYVLLHAQRILVLLLQRVGVVPPLRRPGVPDLRPHGGSAMTRPRTHFPELPDSPVTSRPGPPLASAGQLHP